MLQENYEITIVGRQTVDGQNDEVRVDTLGDYNERNGNLYISCLLYTSCGYRCGSYPPAERRRYFHSIRSPAHYPYPGNQRSRWSTGRPTPKRGTYRNAVPSGGYQMCIRDSPLSYRIMRFSAVPQLPACGLSSQRTEKPETDRRSQRWQQPLHGMYRKYHSCSHKLP